MSGLVRVGRKRSSASFSATLQTSHTQTHRNYFEVTGDFRNDNDNLSELVSVVSSFFDFDFLTTVSNIKNVDTPAHLDFNTWSTKLSEKHLFECEHIIAVTSTLGESGKLIHDLLNQVREMLQLWATVETETSKLVCLTENACGATSNAEEVRKLDNSHYCNREDSIAKIADISKWFTENKTTHPSLKMKNLVSHWSHVVLVDTYAMCCGMLANRLQVLEDQLLMDNVVGHLKKDPRLFLQMQQRKQLFDFLNGPETGVEKTDYSVIGPPESFFRRARSQWGSATPTPGFMGEELDTFYKRQKVCIFTKNDHEHFGKLVSDIVPPLCVKDTIQSGIAREIDIFTVDYLFQEKLSRYFSEEPTYERFRHFVENEYVPGSAVFFGPSLMGNQQPTNTTKSAFLAVIIKAPSHCWHSNQVTTIGFSLVFYLMSWSSEHGEYFLGCQKDLETRNSTQRRRLILQKGSAVLASQLPGKKNIDAQYRNFIYYGRRLNADDSEEDGGFTKTFSVSDD